MIKEYSFDLYRYDVVKPPEKWDTSFNNPEYVYPDVGNKNQAGLFFFSSDEDIVNDLALKACEKEKVITYYKTSTTATKVNLLDFSNRFNIYQMFAVLDDLGLKENLVDFDIFEDDRKFKELIDIYDKIEKSNNKLEKVNLMNKLVLHKNSDFLDISLFGQRLTDFGNGPLFKEMVQQKYPEVDGYIWKEFKDDRGFTICLFNSDKLGDIISSATNL